MQMQTEKIEIRYALSCLQHLYRVLFENELYRRCWVVPALRRDTHKRVDAGALACGLAFSTLRCGFPLGFSAVGDALERGPSERKRNRGINRILRCLAVPSAPAQNIPANHQARMAPASDGAGLKCCVGLGLVVSYEGNPGAFIALFNGVDDDLPAGVFQ